MDQLHLIESKRTVDRANGRSETRVRRNVVARRQRMRGIQAYADRQVVQQRSELGHLFERAAYARTLTGGILDENGQPVLATASAEFQTARRNFDRIYRGANCPFFIDPAS